MPRMKKTNLSRNASALCQLAAKILEAGGFWERQFLIDSLLKKVELRLNRADDAALEDALNFLADEAPNAHDILADIVEAASEIPKPKPALKNLHCQLIACPVLAWSRYSVPGGKLSREFLRDFGAVFLENIASPNVRHLILGNFLLSPDELPQSFSQIYALSNQFADKKKDSQKFSIFDLKIKDSPKNEFLSDVRFVLALLVVEKGQPLFIWQDDPKITREIVAAIWAEKSRKVFAPALVGAMYQPLLPASFNAACRQSDLESRGYALDSAIQFLKESLHILPEQMRVIVAYCYSRQGEEYRISLATHHGHVLYGVVWPMLPGENDEGEVLSEIQEIAKKHRILGFNVLNERLPLEFCDDCGSPLFPTLSGEFLHPQMPQQADLIGENVLN